MKIGHQVVELLLGDYIAEGGHLGFAANDHLAHAIIVRRSSAGEIGLFENPLQAGSAPGPRAVGIMAKAALAVEDATSPGLLGVESKLLVALSPLEAAATENRDKQRKQEQQNASQAVTSNTKFSGLGRVPTGCGRGKMDGGSSIGAKYCPNYNNTELCRFS